MNYSRNIKKASIGKRVLISWVVVAIIFSLVGFGIGAICSRNDSPEQPEPDMDEDLQEFIFYLSQAYEMDFTFVMALIQRESSYNPDAISASNDYGLMQINEINHPYLQEQLGITDFTEPYGNVRAGMFILRKLFEKYETPEKVLMAYNMGETGASRLWEQGIFEINYSKSVLQIQQELNAELERSSNND